MSAYLDAANASFDLYFSFRNPDPPERFIGLALAELRAERDFAKAEADRQACLTALAAAEAAFRLDYLRRAESRLRDDISRQFRRIHHDRKAAARLDDDIVGTWKQHFPAHRTRLEEFNGAMKYRHWLAHGRYYNPKLGRAFDFSGLEPLLASLFAALPLKS